MGRFNTKSKKRDQRSKSNTATMVITALLCASCGGGNSNTPPPPPPITNATPAITSANTASVAERDGDAFYTLTATDAENDPITLSINGGADASAFTLDSATGALAFNSPADFENPTDVDGDNVYNLTLGASDGNSSSTLNLQVSVTDVTNIPMRVTRIAQGLDRPIYATGAGDDSNRLFVVQQGGQIRIIDLTTNTLEAIPFLDVTPDVSTGFEQGLIGLAFPPNYSTSGLFYIYITNVAGDTEVLEYSVSTTNPNIADPTSRRLILTFPQPFAIHNAGWIDFGSDGFLYIASGDGGSPGDSLGNGQNTATLNATMLRIDPSFDAFPSDNNANYAIPADNPFVNAAGADEIYAYGLRNPFRSSFDRATGDLYIGDVGQDEIEEIDLIPAGVGGLNFGWNILEGTRTFTAGATTDLTPPIAEYLHDNSPTGGFSVTGGYVHRGSVEALFGQYVFADFVSGNIWSIPVSNIAQGQTLTGADFTIQTSTLSTPDLGNIANISSFGEDDNGELYIIEFFRNEIFRIENDE